MSEPPLLCGKPPQPQPDILNGPLPLPNGLKSTATPPHASSQPSCPPPNHPQKRRGRPPGRPNHTRESEYNSNPSVQLWNAHRALNPIPAVAVDMRHALPESSLVRDAQRAIFRLPCRETIYFVQGWITARQIASNRPSYVNGLLIHSRGEDSPASCAQCAEKRDKDALGPFLVCRVLPGCFHDCCSNCKWFDGASGCSLYTGPKPNRKRKKDVDGDGVGTREVDGTSTDGIGTDGTDVIDPALSSDLFLAQLAESVGQNGLLTAEDGHS